MTALLPDCVTALFAHLRLVDGQPQGGPFSRRTYDFDGAAVQLHNLPGDVKAQSMASILVIASCAAREEFVP